jgi:23S rRNA (pseudouridine1915-N3)-methyltransferase
LGGYVIPLCIEGESISSKNLADKIANLGVDGVSQISFIIGSSEGLSDKVKDKADFKLSMSEMTFPHQLARVMILEQIYRAFSIINNGKYHK